ncbi:hypothetical protein E4U58_006931 [Claviceps cyperi]|nr:hypothetical protein E4U58_006931 [Claviceps cyperi]
MSLHWSTILPVLIQAGEFSSLQSCLILNMFHLVILTQPMGPNTNTPDSLHLASDCFLIIKQNQLKFW